MKEALQTLVREAYRVRDSEYMVADTDGYAYYWSDIASNSLFKQNVSEEMLVTYVEYLIQNIYVNIGNKTYRECIGIPMGTYWWQISFFFAMNISI